MLDYYDSNIIPVILETFKVNEIIVSCLNNEKILNEINYYSENISPTKSKESKLKFINNTPLKELSTLKNYDAIFIDGDANWYTIFNELKIIKENNEEFPIVFICNNKFPNKHRDSYINPNRIPRKFRQKYSAELPIPHKNGEINIFDGFYHAQVENTEKNGVSTAINDFLSENIQISMMNINLIDEITILYPKSPINQKRIGIIIKKAKKMDKICLTDKLVENNLLISHISKNNDSDINLSNLQLEISNKNSLIKDYENKLKDKNNELDYKNSQINNIKSTINLKNSEIKNIESKLVNKEKQIDNLKDQIKTLNKNIDEKIILKNTFETQIQNNIEEINAKDFNINQKNNQLKNKQEEIDFLQRQLKLTKEKYDNINRNLTQKEDLFYKKELELKNQIQNNIEEINKKDSKIIQKEKELENKQEEINKKDSKIIQKEKELENKQEEINKKDSKIIQKEKELENKQEEINKKDSKIIQKEKELENKQEEINKKDSKIIQKEKELENKQEEINKKDSKIIQKEKQLNSIEQECLKQASKMDINKYCISCFKDEISNNHAEITYLKNNSLLKKILTPLSYIYLILKSNPKEISINLKLYKTIKNSSCFDIGFYLNNNSDLIESKWCKYFSPELHYVCKGFKEHRLFNKKYFKSNSKEDLLNYILTCQNK